MRKEVVFFILIFNVLLIVFTANVEASISTDGILSIYNIGDTLEYKASIIEKTSGQHIFKAILNCQGIENVYFATPINLESDKSFTIQVQGLKLTKNLAGDCFLKISVQNNNLEIVEEIKTNVFKISPEIKANLKFSNEVLPGTFFDINGDVFYANGKLFNGKGKVSFLESSNELEIKDGKLTTKFLVPDKIKSKPYTITFTASDDLGNSANSQAQVLVIQFPTTLRIFTNNETFAPQQKLIATSQVLDQAGDEIFNVETSLELLDATGDKEKDKQKVAEAKNILEYTFSKFSNPGKFIITAKYLSLASEKEIAVLPFEKLDVKLTGNTIAVQNLGNIEYSRFLIIHLGNQTFTQNLSKEVILRPNETREFEISAPQGNYTLQVENKNFSNVPLTGGLISVNEKGDNFSRYSFILLLIIIILISILIIQNLKRNTKPRYTHNWTRKRSVHYKREEPKENSESKENT